MTEYEIIEGKRLKYKPGFYMAMPEPGELDNIWKRPETGKLLWDLSEILASFEDENAKD